MRSTGVETLPLKGLRVVDLSRVFAMPYAAAFLADLGAEVIKVEGCGFLAADTRLGGPFGGPWADDVPGDLHWERNGVFHVLNRGKRSVTLDLNQTDGLDALKKLIATSDVVVENFTPRVMRKFGLDYPNMRELRADIIMLSNTGYGHSGPFSHYGAMAASLEPTHGCGAFIGYEGGAPNKIGNSYTDFLASWTALYSVMAALLYRKRTGNGLWIDLAMYQVGTAFMGEGLLDYAFNGRISRRMGNRHEFHAPHNTYACRGEDRWVTIAVTDEEQWRALCEVMKAPALAHDQRFASSLARVKNVDALDEIVNAWTSPLDHYDVAHRLQAAGVPAGPVLDARDLFTDPHLAVRKFFDPVQHPPETGVGCRPQLGRPWRFSAFEVPTPAPGPRLGEANEEVLGGLLGLNETQLAAMAGAGVIGSEPAAALVPKPVPVAQQLRLGRLVELDRLYRQRLQVDDESAEHEPEV
jgi:crotonobetainyl-CoA:carnitine CoA-transferase CaiB-like acyl-CoA transferase